MRWRSIGLWLSLGGVLYLGAAGFRAAPARPFSWLGLAVGPLVVLVGFALAAPRRRGLDTAHTTARHAVRALVTGLAVAVVAELGPASGLYAVARVVGIGVACTASLVALTRAASLGGLAQLPLRWHHLDVAVVAGLLWGGAAGIGVARALEIPAVGATLSDFAVVTAALGSTGLGVVAALRLYAARRFELGIADRASSALWVSALGAIVAVGAGLARVAEPERLAPTAALVCAAGIGACAVAREVQRVVGALRLGAVAVLTAAPIVSAGVVAAYQWPTRAGLTVFLAATGAVVAALATPWLARSLQPALGRSLRTIDAALRAAKDPDPARAVPAVLCAIRDGLGTGRGATGLLGADTGPALYRLPSADRIVVDRADYPRVEPAAVPGRLVEVAAKEPYKLVTEGALAVAQVRRPELRPVAEWMRVHAASAAALVLDDDVCVGVLLWPRARRYAPLAVAEAAGLRLLADHLGTASGAAAQLARARQQELSAARAESEAAARVSALEGALGREERRREAWARTLAAPVRVACYSGAAQTALAEVERLAADGRPFALVAQAGIDPLGWAAAAHVASTRRQGVVVFVDGAHPADQALEHWNDPERSPLLAAKDGTLVLAAPHALPLETQRWLGTSLARRSDRPAPPGDRTAALIVIVPATVDALAAAGAIDAHLADALGDRAVLLPALAVRHEDLRALALDKLGHIGRHLRGAPLGLSLRAQAVVNDYDWPGNDAELEAVLTLAALESTGDVVRHEAVERALGRRAGGGRAGRDAARRRRSG